MEQYNIKWDTPSENPDGSMPFGGHSVGGNVWVEQDKIYIYLAQSGWLDENNSMLKAGRFCITVQPSPFDACFSQELMLEEGCVRICGDENFALELWAEVKRPVVHMQMRSALPRTVAVEYQTWRFANRTVDRLSYELFQCKEVFFYPLADAVFHKDIICPQKHSLWFYHRNEDSDLSFDKEMKDQGLGEYRSALYNPQKDLIMGGKIDFGTLVFSGETKGTYVDTRYEGKRYTTLSPQTAVDMAVCLKAQTERDIDLWKTNVEVTLQQSLEDVAHAKEEAVDWWKNFFAQSYILLDENKKNTTAWRMGRNYNLFRFMLGLNALGVWPTKFNGGLLTFDPSLAGESPWSDDSLHYTPDFRLWGGGSHTIQNQRLLYWPMLKSGDFSMLQQHFNFFLRTLETAKRNVTAHLDAKGAMYPEQVGTYGLCCGCDNEWGNRTGLPVSQIKYHFSNSLETALMMLDSAEFTGKSPQPYLEFIENILLFYDTFYPQNDENGCMILYPANAMETFHVVKNPVDAIAGLTCVLARLLALPESETTAEQRRRWRTMQRRIPPLPTVKKQGKTILAAAQTRSLIHNCEIPQLYPVHPYSLYGLGKPDLQLAIDTARLAPETEEQLTHISWHPTGVQYARLGLVQEAWDFLCRKLDDGSFRFPAFWGPGHDWTPDHNWGGSAMLQLQEMLLQTDGNELRVLPCWPKEVDVSFRLFAPKNTIVECVYRAGEIVSLTVTPPQRKKDVCEN